MYCSNCGKKLDGTEKYCSRCGNKTESTIIQPIKEIDNEQIELPTNKLQNDNSSNNIDNKQSISIYTTKSKQRTIPAPILIIVTIIVIGIIIGTNIISSFSGNSNSYYGNNNYNYNTYIDDSNYPDTNPIKKEYQEVPDGQNTIINYDNYFKNQNISSIDDVKKLIKQEADNQRINCPYDIKQLEIQFQNKYNILGVNLCEMDPDFARNIDDVFSKIYRDYPEIRGNITNFSLKKQEKDENNTYAISYWVKTFSSSTISYYYGKKSSVYLVDYYYLHPQRIINSIKADVEAGYHVPNATAYSVVAHELGHQIEATVTMKHYGLSSILLEDTRNNQRLIDALTDWENNKYSYKLIQEAYNSYKQSGGKDQSIEKWISKISEYATTKDEYGNYNYHETIAEAVEDVYCNNNNAKDASKYITAILKKKLRGE